MNEFKSITIPEGGKISVDCLTTGYTIEGPATILLVKNAGPQEAEPADMKQTN